MGNEKQKNEKSSKIKWKKILIIAMVTTIVTTIVGTVTTWLLELLQSDNSKPVTDTEIDIQVGDGGTAVGKVEGDYNQTITVNQEKELIKPTVSITELDFHRLKEKSAARQQLLGNSLDDTIEYTMEKNYTAMIEIANNDPTQELILRKFTFNAQNIVVDYSPEFLFYSSFYESSGGTGHRDKWQLEVTLVNDGWGDATDVSIVYDSTSENYNIIKSIFPFKELGKTIPLIESRERITTNFMNHLTLDNILLDDYLDNIPEITNAPKFRVVCKEKDFGVPYSETCVTYKKDETIGPYGLGYEGNESYGILIDTSQNSFTLSKDLSESIPSEQILQIPLCFYPDKSSSLNYSVEFEVFDGQDTYTISSDSMQTNFKISSTEEVNRQTISDEMEIKEGVGRTDYFYSFPLGTPSIKSNE